MLKIVYTWLYIPVSLFLHIIGKVQTRSVSDTSYSCLPETWRFENYISLGRQNIFKEINKSIYFKIRIDVSDCFWRRVYKQIYLEHYGSFANVSGPPNRLPTVSGRHLRHQEFTLFSVLFCLTMWKHFSAEPLDELLIWTREQTYFTKLFKVFQLIFAELVPLCK